MKIKPLFCSIMMSTLLVGCTTTPLTAPTQSMDGIKAANQSVYVPASEASKMQTKVVTQYVPVPVPGQLMPSPKRAAVADKITFKTKEEAVNYANKQALVTPKTDDFFNAAMTYDYMPGALYVIYSAPLRITDIILGPGEKIISLAAGDTYRWSLSQTYSGTGESMRYHILVKPTKSGIDNTVVITTNLRVYHLILRATKNDTFMVSVKWKYPESLVNFHQITPPEAHLDTAQSPYQLALDQLDFGYKFGLIEPKDGAKPNWYPVRIFNDGRQTYIEFSKSFNQSGSLPVLFVKDETGKYGTMINWRLKGRYMIVDKIFNNARLLAGIKKTGRTVVQIERTAS